MVGGVGVNSSDALPVVILELPDGTSIEFAEDPGSSDFKAPTDSNLSWGYNLQLVYPVGHPLAGEDLVPEVYGVRIRSRQTNQTFPALGDPAIPITVKASKKKKGK